MINRVVLVGRITKDPELRKTQSGLSTVSFSVACNRRFSGGNQEQTADFINCVAWRSSADFIASYVKKGALIGVEGRIQTRNYDDNSGKRVYVTEVVCDSVQSLEYKREATKAETDMSYQTNQPGATSNEYGNLDISSDDLPF